VLPFTENSTMKKDSSLKLTLICFLRWLYIVTINLARQIMVYLHLYYFGNAMGTKNGYATSNLSVNSVPFCNFSYVYGGIAKILHRLFQQDVVFSQVNALTICHFCRHCYPPRTSHAASSASVNGLIRPCNSFIARLSKPPFDSILFNATSWN